MSKFFRGIHFWLTIAWGILIIPTVLWWGNSIQWVALMSVWANFASHWAAWQSSRGEVKQDNAAL